MAILLVWSLYLLNLLLPFTAQSFFQIFFWFLIMCYVCVYLWVCTVCECDHGGQKPWFSLELKLQVVVSFWIGVLGTDLQSSVGAPSILNY